MEQKEPMNLLVVDDDETIRAFIREAIQPLGMVDRIYEADCVEDAIRLIESGSHQIVILDLLLDRDASSGRCLATRVRERNSDAVIIVITGFPHELYKRELLEVPIDDFLIKPFSVEKLREAMVRAQTRYRRRVLLMRCFEERERMFMQELEKLKHLEDLARKQLDDSGRL